MGLLNADSIRPHLRTMDLRPSTTQKCEETSREQSLSLQGEHGMNFLRALIGLIVVFAIGAVGFIYSGIYDVGATSEDNPVIAWALHQTFAHSVVRRAKDVQVPLNLEMDETVRSGARFYSQNCVVCHGAPGQDRTAISQGLNPQPPDILNAARTNNPANMFWIVKNGVKMSAMPSFGKTQPDQQIWAIAAFLHNSRGISEEKYRELTRAAAGQPPVGPKIE
jgi:mono/diheme cytochrome c family protein